MSSEVGHVGTQIKGNDEKNNEIHYLDSRSNNSNRALTILLVRLCLDRIYLAWSS
jgi:hypothetical protein